MLKIENLKAGIEEAKIFDLHQFWMQLPRVQPESCYFLPQYMERYVSHIYHPLIENHIEKNFQSFYLLLQFEHEATTSKIGEDQIFYCNQRGIGTEEAIALIVNGYCKDVLNQLPMEFAVEAQKLL